MDTTTVDEEAARAFTERLFGIFTDAALAYLIHIGHTTGLFAAAAAGPATSAALADRAGLQERYVREWLAALAYAQIVEYDAASETFWLPREHAASLTGDGVTNLAPIALLTTLLGRNVDGVATAFRTGGGVPWEAFLPDIHPVMDALWQPMYRDLLVPEILPLAPGLVDRLRDGARAADLPAGPATRCWCSGPPSPPPPSSASTSTQPPSNAAERRWRSEA
ncbi:MAG: hypothetical protein IRY85_00920 [Micromonosporaceae bacterium]|nr:hypothetical protein [Micromonosporaceae bacterium]